MASSSDLKKIVLASSNKGKIAELNDALLPLGYEVIPQSEFNCTDAVEDGLSFVENAIKKARHAAQQTGLPALADDSGLEVMSLDGAPGIHSARYAGTHGPVPVIAEGAWSGEILEAPRGENGFGYDPLFFIPSLGSSAAEIPPTEKKKISHRALALGELRLKLKALSIDT